MFDGQFYPTLPYSSWLFQPHYSSPIIVIIDIIIVTIINIIIII